ncbi:MAG: tetratricopeptide repeat protein [bacterium]|nr:tetratricopeptide repeat protein [bacterium]
MKKVSFIILLALAALFIGGQEVSDVFKQVILLENDAFDFYPEYGAILRGEGYIPDADFELMRDKYREFINDSNTNPFYFTAFGFTFHYLKDTDSAASYFKKASELAGTDYAVHLRLYQIYSKHLIKYAMDNEIEQFENIKYKIGAIALPEVALYMNLAALEEYSERNTDRAAEYLILANKLDPYNPEIIENLFNLILRERRFEYIGYAIKMVKDQLSESFNKFVFIFNLMKFVRYLVLTVFFIMTLMIFFRISDKYFYFFKRHIRLPLDKKQKFILGLAVLFVPLILQFNPVLWIFYVAFFAFIFAEKKEKVILFLMLLTVFLTPQLFHMENKILSMMNPNGNVSVMIKADNTYWDIKLLNKINMLIEEQPFNTPLLYAKAKLYKKGGYFEKAEEEYNKILLKKDDFAELYNNIGNIMYLKGYYAKAIENYEKAIEKSPSLAQPYYNLGQVYLKRMELTVSDDYVRKAKEINYDLISPFIENAEDKFYNTEIIDCSVPERFVWNEFLKKQKVSDSPIVMGVNINLISIFAFITLILGFFVSFVFKKKLFIERCHTCGKPISEGDRKRYSDSYICEDDYSSLSETLSDVFKARKFESLIRLRKKAFFKKRKFASLIFPGFSKILEGSSFKGYFLTLLTSVFILLIFSNRILISKNPNLTAGIHFEYGYIFLGIILILYLISFAITKEEK